MDKNTKKFYNFLYQAKKEWANFCFSWLKTIWVNNWKNIMSYSENYDILKQTWIEENFLLSIINEEANINKNIEIKSNYLMIWLNDKWLENYKNYLTPWYKKIKIDWKWLIWIIIALISVFVAYLKLINIK